MITELCWGGAGWGGSRGLGWGGSGGLGWSGSGGLGWSGLGGGSVPDWLRRLFGSR